MRTLVLFSLSLQNWGMQSLLVLLLVSLSSEYPETEIPILAMVPMPGRYSRITPMIRLDNALVMDLQNFRPNRFSSNLDSYLLSIKSHLDHQRPGKRALHIWAMEGTQFNNADDSIQFNDRDRCYDPQRRSYTKYHCPFWNNGIRTMRAKFMSIFEKLAQIQTDVDFIHLSNEIGYSIWGMTEDQFRAIENDPRSGPLLAELGFRDLARLGHYWDYPDGQFLKNRWNTVLGAVVNRAMDQAIYQPIKKYFPKSIVTDYNKYTIKDSIPFWDYNGTPFGPSDQLESPLPGMSSDLNYLYLGQIALDATPPELGSSYPVTAFNRVRYSINLHRAITMSAQDRKLPVTPVIASKGWEESSLGVLGDYYQEHLLHVMMTLPDALVYWNPPDISSSNEHSLISETAKAFDQLAGFHSRTASVDGLLPWRGGYLLSALHVKDRNLFRLTLDLAEAESIQTKIIEDHRGVEVFSSQHRIFFAHGRIENPAGIASKRVGAWISQPKGSRPPLIRELVPIGNSGT